VTDRDWLRCAAWAGSLGVADYLVDHFVPLPPQLEPILFFAEGPLFVVFAVALGRTMCAHRRAVSLELAPILGAIGGAAFAMMAIVQSAIHPIFRQPLDPGLDEASVRTVRTIWRAVDHVQLGMDVTFDVFWMTAVALFGWNMRRDPRFGRVLGLTGAGASLACLALNLGSFPRPPTPDLGPAVGAWGAAVAVALWRALAAAAVRVEPPPAAAAGTGDPS
jgi:hypothetical protein